MKSILFPSLAIALALSCITSAWAGKQDKVDQKFGRYEWQVINGSSHWEARAGLRVLSNEKSLYLMGGRTPLDPQTAPAPGASKIWGDVWKSNDQGDTWVKILDTDDSAHWPARAYFQAVNHRGKLYVLGGQNFKVVPNPECPPFPSGCPPFISQSDFFADVWSSQDGVAWEQEAENAGWAGRAGLSAVTFKGEIYVMAGSEFDDAAVIGGPPVRNYFNDVWKSRDGKTWEEVTPSARWSPRAGAVVVVKNGYMYLIGGEDGFTCLPGLRCPPYYNDVWRSKDGAHWESVTKAAPWASRPGHQVVVHKNYFVLFGGFGLSNDPARPFEPSNPIDMWVSADGEHWSKLDQTPWNAIDPAEIKYDFAALALPASKGKPPGILTFGGDRETFDFTDPNNWLNVDNDVWRFYPW